MTAPRSIPLVHYSDVLCIWAYCAQVRMDEVRSRYPLRVVPEYRLASVFGSAAQKIGAGWADRGGFSGYARHVRDIAARFPHVTVHPDTWERVRPASSTPPHLFLKAVQLLPAETPAASGEAFARAAWALRLAFFRDARDVARREVQLEVAEDLGLPVAAIEAALSDGRAHAALAEDFEGQQRGHIEGSPTIVLDDGRQKLYGNVGYRTIEAMIEELLAGPSTSRASWC